MFKWLLGKEKTAASPLALSPPTLGIADLLAFAEGDPQQEQEWQVCFNEFLDVMAAGSMTYVNKRIIYGKGFDDLFIKSRFLDRTPYRFSKSHHVSSFLYVATHTPQDFSVDVLELLVHRVCWMLPDNTKASMFDWNASEGGDPAAPFEKRCETLVEKLTSSASAIEAFRQTVLREP